jgi:hypothetical protein
VFEVLMIDILYIIIQNIKLLYIQNNAVLNTILVMHSGCSVVCFNIVDTQNY